MIQHDLNNLKDTVKYNPCNDIYTTPFDELDYNSLSVEGQPLLDHILLHSVKENKLDWVNFFIRRGAEVNPHPSVGPGGRLVGNTPPLHIACSNENEIIVRELLNKGADVNAIFSGNNPLHIACSNNNEIIIDILLEAEANVSVVDQRGDTPLHLALNFYNPCPGQMCGNPENIIDKLLNADGGWEMTTVQNNDGNTPLHFAAATLIHFAAGRRPDGRRLSRPAPATESPPHNVNIIQKLKDAGADVNATNTDGNTPLHMAIDVYHPQESIIQKLLDIEANVNATNNYGETPLHLALGEDASERIITKLLGNPDREKRGDPNIRDKKGHTPFYMSIIGGNEGIISRFLEAGGEVTEESIIAVNEVADYYQKKSDGVGADADKPLVVISDYARHQTEKAKKYKNIADKLNKIYRIKQQAAVVQGPAHQPSLELEPDFAKEEHTPIAEE